MGLKFYTDTHIPKQVAIQLQAQNIDVVRCEDVDLAEADDKTHLEYATQAGRILITKDDDFLRLHAQWIQEGREHAGIFFASRRNVAGIGIIVTTCIEFDELIRTGAGTANDISNKVVYI